MTTAARAFILLWCAGVVWQSVVALRRGIPGLRSRSAQLSWNRSWFERGRDPVEYWLAVSGEFLVALVPGPFLLWFAWELGPR